MSQTLKAVIGDDLGPPLRVMFVDADGVVNVPTRLTAGAGAFKTFKRSLTTGTGANQANKFWYKVARSLAAGANDDWVLRGGGANTLDRYGNAITWLKVKYLLLRLTAPATGQYLLLGNAVAPWGGWWGGGATTLTAKVKIEHIDDIDGITVNVNDTLRVRNPGASAVSYDIVLLGTG